MIMVAEAMIDYAQRNAAYCLQLAETESDPERVEELKEMARICNKVPQYPAESWWEAYSVFTFYVRQRH